MNPWKYLAVLAVLAAGSLSAAALLPLEDNGEPPDNHRTTVIATAEPVLVGVLTSWPDGWAHFSVPPPVEKEPGDDLDTDAILRAAGITHIAVPSAPAAAPAATPGRPAATPATTAAPAALQAAGASVTGATRPGIEGVICAAFGPSLCAWAVCIAEHESGLNPGAVGRGGERGLFQIHPVHFGRFDPGSLFDPAYNAAAAYQIYRSSGPSAWTTARSC